MSLPENLKKIVKGEVQTDEATLKKFSHDASLFEVKPEVVIAPRDSEDIKSLVKFAAKTPSISLTARSGGTDMTGGPLSESIVLDFTKHFTKIKNLGNGRFSAEPGVWYRDFERETLKENYLLPSYPASREICAMGGIVNNNSGGEKTLKYGKTENYVASVKIALSDGNEYEITKLSKNELKEKMGEKNFLGEIYKNLFPLFEKNDDLIKKAEPKVSKNSAGYNIWKVWDKKSGDFDLTKLIVGAQGTLGIVTETTLNLVEAKPKSGLLVIFMKNLAPLPDVVHAVLPVGPVSFESFDDNTLKLAIKFFWGFAQRLGVKNLLALGFKFLPEFFMMLTGLPKLVLLAEFEGETQEEVDKQIKKAREKLKNLRVKTRIANTEEKAKKYWVIRHESFNLLRQRVKGKRTAPFIDDIIVRPEYLPEFLPKLTVILEKYKNYLSFTIAGHVGDGNFHIIPLMKMASEAEKETIFKAMDEVFDLVLKYEGSITAEHNDGLIRTPYIEKMYGKEIYSIFKEIKEIFDPQNIFNPGKKVGGDIAYAKDHIRIGV
ncbi:MAG: FAD-binding oxidoreductase [Candidatus Harrisonbacteria bacterium]|nr:FAD-binding oxidoreductase [Candidatus Harrisonbacteria bacterium]